jgi:hypothetical protein
MTEHTVRLKAEKVTKNTVRFQEETADGKPPVIGSLYIPKWVCGEDQEIEVTIRPVAAVKGKGK